MDEVNAPLYPFGYGLSYISYEYGPVTLSSAEMPLDGSVTASVTVTNTGKRDYQSNVRLYPEFQAYFRKHQPRLVAVMACASPGLFFWNMKAVG